MRKADQLDHKQLAEIVESVQTFLYLDQDGAGREFWNPDKEWDGGDILDKIAWLLGEHDLVPDQRQSPEGTSYVLYDLDAETLVSTSVYSSYQDAADDAASVDDVLILRLDVPARKTPADQPVTVRLQSEEHGCEDFGYENLDEALAAVRRLYVESVGQEDHVERQISILVEPKRNQAATD